MTEGNKSQGQNFEYLNPYSRAAVRWKQLKESIGKSKNSKLMAPHLNLLFEESLITLSRIFSELQFLAVYSNLSNFH